MIRIYYLESEIVNGVQQVKGQKYIRYAILAFEDFLGKLIQDTTDDEHAGLIAVATRWREPTTAETAELATLPKPPPPDTTIIRIKELLADLPTITLPAKVKELLALFGKKLAP